MKILSRLKKLFIGGTWYVGIRDTKSSVSNYKNVETPKGQWVADPFLFEEGGKHYLFCEQFITRENKAGISCYEIVNGVATHGKLIIQEPYHLSYPCVFKINDKHYMIPESSANNTIDLYEASEFPFKWIYKKTLLQGVKYVDTTVHIVDSLIYLLSYKKNASGWELVIFSMNRESFELDIVSSRKYYSNVGRPAGLLFKEKDKLIRPAQLCQSKYGESIVFYEVDSRFDRPFNEHKIGELTTQGINFHIPIDRIHTINKDSRYEVIDLFKEQIDILHGFKILKRAYLKK